MNEDERRKNLQKMRLGRLIGNFGLPQHLFNDYRLSNFKVVPGTEQAFKLTCQYLHITPDLKWPEEVYDCQADVDAWDKCQPDQHHFLTFVGWCGRGKTHLALAIGIWYIEKLELQSVYYQVPELLNTLRHSYEADSELSHVEIMAKCREADLLILDDFGMQSNTTWAVEQLDSLVDHRYIHRLDTVFTTNLAPGKLPPRISSRIKEGEVVQFTGDDYREEIAGRRLAQRIGR